MKITAQLSGVNRPLSVELRLINFCSCDFDSQEENHTAAGQLLLTKRSDFRSAEGLVRCSPFGGVGLGKQPGRYRRFVEERERRSRDSSWLEALVADGPRRGRPRAEAKAVKSVLLSIERAIRARHAKFLVSGFKFLVVDLPPSEELRIRKAGRPKSVAYLMRKLIKMADFRSRASE